MNWDVTGCKTFLLAQQYVIISLLDRLFSEYFILHACRKKSLFQLVIYIYTPHSVIADQVNDSEPRAWLHF